MRRLVILVSLSTGGLLWAQNVGIGTASPSEKLHVSGNLRLDGAFMPGNQAGTKGAILRSDGANNPPIWVAPTANGQVLISTTSGTDYLPTWANGNGLFWSLTGNSGTNIATNFIGTTDNVGLAFRTNNVERMRITNAGNVAIGTTNPDGRFDVRQTTNNPVALFTTYGSVNRVMLRRAQGTIDNPTSTSGANTVLGRIDAQGYDGTGFTSAARIEMATDAAGGTSTDMPGRITFHTTPDGSGTLVERMRITSAGNVGIGLTDPQVLLEIFAHQTGNTDIGGRLRLSANGDGGRKTYIDFAPWRGRPGGPGAQIIGEDDNAGAAHLRFYTAPPNNNNAAPIERMRIESDGDIFGRFRHVTYHTLYNSLWTGNPGNRVLWFPCPGGDGCDDSQIGGSGTPGLNDYRQQWVAPYDGRIVRVIVRVGAHSGSNPEFRGRICRSFNGNHAVMSNTSEADDNQWTQFDCYQNNTFSRGDRIAVGLDLNCNNCYAEDTAYYVAVIWEYYVWD